MRFLTPDETRLLTSLPDHEADVLRAMFDQLDARLVTEGANAGVAQVRGGPTREELRVRTPRPAAPSVTSQDVLFRQEDRP
jgi:hypothetical protein